jgi:hypothetical protein
MANTKSSSSILILHDEIDRLVSLCTHIAQTASHIRLVHLSNISYSTENIQSSCELLLSMAENIEGSAILLESLLAIQQRNLIPMNKKQSTRIHYTREESLQLRKHVTSALSDKIGNLLKHVVECESNGSVQIERQSRRDIRTILI